MNLFALVGFAGLWLASTVFLILLYTNQEEFKNENNRLKAANSKLISSSEMSSIAIVGGAREGGPTAVGLLEQERAATAELATGGAEDSSGAVQTKLDQMLASIRAENVVTQADSYEGISYHDALDRLYTAYKAERNRRGTAEKQVGEMESQVATVIEADAARQNEFEQKTKEVSDKLGQCETARNTFRDERDKALAKLEQDLEDTRRQSTDELTTERQARLFAEKRFTELQQRYTAQQAKLGDLLIGPEDLVTARQPDGNILSAVPGDDIVYINLGKKDTMTLGMQFGVYSADTGIPADGRAKAYVEVASISDNSAECRITRIAPGRVILEGDLIANPIYDPAHKPTFVVIGEFDLNRDGVLDRNGADAIESLIRSWGGQTSDELTPLTDFVVLGAAPRKPRPGGQSGLQPIGAEAWEHFNTTTETAMNLSVPIMTQDTFLNFLGYTSRFARR
jgi:hypothetical protein